MALLLSTRSIATARTAAAPRTAVPLSRRSVSCKSYAELFALAAAAAPGDVAAPPGALLIGAAVVTIAATAVIPLALKPGESPDASRIASPPLQMNCELTALGALATRRPGGGRPDL